jgi:hypothetical protein
MTTVHPDGRPEHPVVTKLRERRAADAQLRVADAITKFAGSMAFVYLHVAAFAVWMLFIERARSTPSPPNFTAVCSRRRNHCATHLVAQRSRGSMWIFGPGPARAGRSPANTAPTWSSPTVAATTGRGSTTPSA